MMDIQPQSPDVLEQRPSFINKSALDLLVIRLGLVPHRYNRITLWFIWGLTGWYIVAVYHALYDPRVVHSALIKWKRWALIFGYFPKGTESAMYLGAIASFLFSSLTVTHLRINSPQWQEIFVRLVPARMRRRRFQQISRQASRIINLSFIAFFLVGSLLQLAPLFMKRELRNAMDIWDFVRIAPFGLGGAMTAKTLITASVLFSLQSANLYYRSMRIHAIMRGKVGRSLDEIEEEIGRLRRDIAQCNKIWSLYLALFQFLVTVMLTCQIKFLGPQNLLVIRLGGGRALLC